MEDDEVIKKMEAEAEKKFEALKIEKEEALARMAESDTKLQKMREKIRQTEKRLHQLQKQKNIKPETDLTREDLSAAELMAVLKKQPKKFKK